MSLSLFDFLAAGLLQAQLQRALEGVARLADRERRTLSIQLDGTGARKVRVGFVAGAPRACGRSS